MLLSIHFQWNLISFTQLLLLLCFNEQRKKEKKIAFAEPNIKSVIVKIASSCSIIILRYATVGYWLPHFYSSVPLGLFLLPKGLTFSRCLHWEKLPFKSIRGALWVYFFFINQINMRYLISCFLRMKLNSVFQCLFLWLFKWKTGKSERVMTYKRPTHWHIYDSLLICHSCTQLDHSVLFSLFK